MIGARSLATARDGLEVCLTTALGAVLAMYVRLQLDCIACSRSVLQLAYNGVGNVQTKEPAAMLRGAYSELRVLARRVVAVRLREELLVTGVLRNINQRTNMSLCRSSWPSARVPRFAGWPTSDTSEFARCETVPGRKEAALCESEGDAELRRLPIRVLRYREDMLVKQADNVRDLSYVLVRASQLHERGRRT